MTKLSQYGPHRSDPLRGTPKHAYSPFKDEQEPPPRVPQPGKDFMADRVLIKVKPGVRWLPQQADAFFDDHAFNERLTALGILDVEPVFPKVAAPPQNLLDPGLIKPADLVRWHRARLAPQSKVLEVVAKLKEDPAVEYAEPDYLRRPAVESMFQKPDPHRSSRGNEAHFFKSEIQNPKSKIDQSLLTSAATLKTGPGTVHSAAPDESKSCCGASLNLIGMRSTASLPAPKRSRDIRLLSPHPGPLPRGEGGLDAVAGWRRSVSEWAETASDLPSSWGEGQGEGNRRVGPPDDARRIAAVSVPNPTNPSQTLGKQSASQASNSGTARAQSLPGQSSIASIPNSGSDPKFNDQWHLGAAKIPEAWAYLQSRGLPPGGNRDIIVAVIDTGVDYNHPDLAANMWTNSREIPGNGVDDDRNGYVDDVRGIDAITNSGNPMDDHGHGTHVAGIIAAQANNNAGVVGVAYNTQIMALKAAQYSGVLASSDIAEAINYAVAQGASVINMSFGGYNKSQIEEDALAVAFGQAVLVAAAGNDGKVNLPCRFGQDFYPAAYNWVLGVMASTRTNSLASFSNFDCEPHDAHEYELMAPGVDIWSTLPHGQFAAWDGTSMSAPIVSGIAALARTKFTDKDVYSSRFIMGQIAMNAGAVANAINTLTNTPRPELSYLEHWLFDTTAQSSANDNDGIVDAGETIDLAIVIRNHWGKADPVSVKLEAWAEKGAVQADPYVTMITNIVDYGAIGSFNWDDNGLIYDAQKVITGVRNPFRFRVSPDTPNDHVIPFRLTMTGKNGLDPGDTNEYAFQDRFNLVVQRGRELPRIISTNMTLTKDYFWIVPGQTLIEQTATVTITEGTQVQFWPADTKQQVYAEGSLNPASVYWKVLGRLVIQGTQSEPVEIFPSLLFNNYPISILSHAPESYEFALVYEPSPSPCNCDLSYVRVLNPFVQVSRIHHAYFSQQNPDGIEWPDSAGNGFAGKARATSISQSIFHKLTSNIGSMLPSTVRVVNNWSLPIGPSATENLYDSCRFFSYPDLGHQNTLLTTGGQSRIALNGGAKDNAILNRLWQLDINNDWIRVYSSTHAENNYWGTTSKTLIDAVIHDFKDDFNLPEVIYEPILTNPPPTAYPFVADVVLSTSATNRTAIVGAEPITFTVTYNRDMDTNVLPSVTFGPDTPQTDYTVHPINGGWQNPRTWKGTFNVNPITGDGYQLMRIAGGRAADDPWLVAGDDVARFRFEIITSGTESMNLQANGGEGRVDLAWTQNDFDLLAGFNVYRSTNRTNNFSRLNTGLIPSDKRSLRDAAVQPGVPYYYKFTVVKTDLTESDPSNVATATPLDTIPPVVSHTPVTSSPPGLALTLFADVTDNVGVQSVTLYFRAIGSSAYSSRAMTLTTGSRYAATVEGSRVTSPGLEYYVEATDGVSTTRAGNAGLPYQIRVEDRPTVTAVSPVRGPASGGTAVTIAGSNFKSGATVTFSGAAAGSVSVVSSNQITCVTPASFPATVDVTVRNSDGQTGTLLRAFTYESDITSASIPTTGGGQRSTVQVPITAANLQGLAAASLTVTFDGAVLRALSARTGTLTPGWSVAANTNNAGQIRLSMASPGGTASGSGTLALIEFEVLGAPGATSPLRLTNVSLNDGAIRVQLTDGSFAVNLVYDVSGTVRFWNGSTPVSNVVFTLKGDRVYSGQSGSNGVYRVAGAESGNYTLTPVKSDEVKAITAFDASLALQHDAGLITLSGSAAAAADVNKSGSITSFDAFLILQKSVDLITVPFSGAGVVWDFSPATRTFSNLNSHQTGQDFTAILLGDVSGNWSQPTLQGGPSIQGVLAEKTKDIEPVLVGLKQATLAGADEARAWLLVSAPKPAVYSIDVKLAHDGGASGLKWLRTGPEAATFSMAVGTNQPGIVHVALAGPVPLQGPARVLVMNLSQSMAGSPRILDVRINEGSVPVRIDPVAESFGLDSDGDGQSDWEEILAGTNPRDAQSVLGIKQIRPNRDGSKTISWVSVPGKTYCVQYKEAVADAHWKDIPGYVMAEGSGASKTDHPSSGASQRIYRVKLVE
jgi:subtilisin family serine protease